MPIFRREWLSRMTVDPADAQGAHVPPQRYLTCRFFGGPLDGNVWRVHPDILRGPGIIRVPLKPRYRFSAITGHGEFPTDTDAVIIVYRWDLTVNEAGEHRMRLEDQYRYIGMPRITPPEI